MPIIDVNGLRNGVVFKEDNQILQVINFEHIKMGRGGGVIKVKVRNLKNGAVTEKSFPNGSRVDSAEIDKQKTQFLYKDEDNYYFMNPQTFEQFPLSQNIVGEEAKYLKDGLEVNLIVLDEQALSLELSNSIVYEIKETGPAEKGNTVSSVYKEATLDNGLVVRVPMFMNVGEKVKIDTRTGQYVERVK